LGSNGGTQSGGLLYPPLQGLSWKTGNSSWDTPGYRIQRKWKEYAFVWGAIIAASQVVDALKDVFPFTKRHKAAIEHTITLASIFIDAQLEWENIFSGRYTDDQIMNLRHKLMKLQHEVERTSFPDGLATQDALFAESQKDAEEYFTATYGVY
jgi:hypothetical protein